jgi:hypothetical protein
VNWRAEAVTADMQEVLRSLPAQGFYLAGGTALALWLGHRRSVDLDLFHPGTFDVGALVARLQSVDGTVLVSQTEQTVHVHVRSTKVRFLGYPYPVLFPLAEFLGVPIADPPDIACMKVSAIAARGARRDFIDLHAAARRYGLDEILRLFREKYARLNYSMVHVLKALTYFDDAEKEPSPDMLEPVAWPDVKAYFLREAPRLL